MAIDESKAIEPFVFIAYSSKKDRKKAERLSEELDRRGISVWTDWSRDPNSSGLTKDIEEHLETCAVCVLLFTRTLKETPSSQANREALKAYNNHGRLYIAVYRGLNRNDVVHTLLDADRDYFPSYKALADTLQRKVEEAYPNAATDDNLPPPTRQRPPSSTSDAFLTALKKLISRSDLKREPTPEQAGEVLSLLRGIDLGAAGLDTDFAERFRRLLKSDDYDRLYFIDILGSDVWSRPTFLGHITYQIRHYVKMNFHTAEWDERGTAMKGRIWNLDFTGSVGKAIKLCNQRAAKSKALAQSDVVQLFPRLGERRLPPAYEIARILIWPEQDLLTVPAEVLIYLHKIVKIPLFHLPPSAVSGAASRLGDLSRYEYHVFSHSANARPLAGELYDSEEETRRSFGFLQKMPTGFQKPLVHFKRLLRLPQLQFAYYRREELQR